MEEHQEGQPLPPRFCICRMVDAYGNLIVVWPRDMLIGDALNWDFGLDMPATLCQAEI